MLNIILSRPIASVVIFLIIIITGYSALSYAKEYHCTESWSRYETMLKGRQRFPDFIFRPGKFCSSYKPNHIK